MTAKKAELPGPRFLKVGYHYYESRRKEDCPRSRTVPYVRLCGDWLQDAGFAVGQRVRVQVVDQCIVILPDL